MVPPGEGGDPNDPTLSDDTSNDTEEEKDPYEGTSRQGLVDAGYDERDIAGESVDTEQLAISFNGSDTTRAPEPEEGVHIKIESTGPPRIDTEGATPSDDAITESDRNTEGSTKDEAVEPAEETAENNSDENEATSDYLLEAFLEKTVQYSEDRRKREISLLEAIQKHQMKVHFSSIPEKSVFDYKGRVIEDAIQRICPTREDCEKLIEALDRERDEINKELDNDEVYQRADRAGQAHFYETQERQRIRALQLGEAMEYIRKLSKTSLYEAEEPEAENRTTEKIKRYKENPNLYLEDVTRLVDEFKSLIESGQRNSPRMKEISLEMLGGGPLLMAIREEAINAGVYEAIKEQRRIFNEIEESLRRK